MATFKCPSISTGTAERRRRWLGVRCLNTGTPSDDHGPIAASVVTNIAAAAEAVLNTHETLDGRKIAAVPINDALLLFDSDRQTDFDAERTNMDDNTIDVFRQEKGGWVDAGASETAWRD